MKINLRIDRLTLHGIRLTPTDRAVMESALKNEIERLLASGMDSAPWGDLRDQASVESETISYQPGNKPELLGRRLARAVHGSLLR
jgi:hypothetical protein